MALRNRPKIKLTGARELERALRELPKRTGKAALRRALKKTAQPIEVTAEQYATRAKPELAARGISISTRLSRRQKRGRQTDRNTVQMYVGAHSARYGLAHLFEFGTAQRHHKSGKSTGRMRPQPFMRPAWDANKGRLLDTLGRELWTEVDKAAKRLAKRRARGTSS